MRKKSHISLAKHLVTVAEVQSFNRHRKAFYIGSILPDCKPSFITRRHEITETFPFVEHKIQKLTHGYHSIGDLSTAYFTRLGEVIHYIADYFTFPHNKEYLGTIKEHCVYEGQLKHRLRSYIQAVHEQESLTGESLMLSAGSLRQFESVSDICSFIREEHRKYIKKAVHSVEEDCKYIVKICSQVVMAILHVCISSMEYQYNQ